jgi:MFS family permease
MNKKAEHNGYLFSKGYTNYVFILLFLLYMFDYVDRMIVTSLFPFIKVEWNLTDTQLGALISAVYWSIVCLTIPASILVDRWSRRRTIGTMAALWSLATAAASFTKSFPQLFITRTLIGVGEAGYAPGGTAMISGLYPKEKRSWMMGIWNASIPLGGAIGVAVGGIIAAKWGWRSAFGIVALPGLIVAILFFFIKDYKTVDLLKNSNGKSLTNGAENNPEDSVGEKSFQAKMSFKDIAKEFLGKPSLILTYFGMTGIVFVTTSLLSWLPSYFSRLDNIPLQKAGTKASLVMLLAIVGAPLGGYLTDKWRKNKENARMILPSITTMIAALFAFLAFVVFDGTLQYISLLLLGISVTMFLPAAGAVTQDLVHPGLRATSYAFAVITQNLLGASAGPIVIGMISDKTDISTALSILPIFLVLSSLLFFIGSFFYKKDLEKVVDVPLEVWA